MKILNAKINNFGKLNDLNIEFSKINLVMGENESGKSTLQQFILDMLYGISKNKEGKTISNFEIYKPWDLEGFSGKLEYQINKKKYNVFRDFNKNELSLTDDLGKDIVKSYKIDKKNGSQFFYEQTGIDRNILEKTTVIRQNSVILEKSDQIDLVQKIVNLLDTGSEDISYKKVEKNISEMEKENVGTKRTVDRPINNIKIEKEKIKKEINEMEENKYNKNDLENEVNLINFKIEENNLKKIIYSKINNFINDKKSEENKIKIEENLLLDNAEKIYNIEKNKCIELRNNIIENYLNKKEEIEENEKKALKEIEDERLKKDKKIKINKKILFINLFINLFFNIINLIYLKNNYFYLILLIYFIFSIIFFIKNKKIDKTNNLNNEFTDLKNKIENEKNNEIEKLNILEKEKKENYEKNIIENNNKIKEKKNKLINLELDLKKEIKKDFNVDIDELFNNINYFIKINEKDIQEKIIEKTRKEKDIENIQEKLEKYIELKEKMELIEKEEIRLEFESEVYKIVKETLKEAYDDLKSEIFLKFKEEILENVNLIMGNKYNKIIVDEGLLVELKSGKIINSESLSQGTIEQIYFALRFAILKTISDIKFPLILDESFVFYDDERLKNIIKMLKNIDNQVIIFTCSDREERALISENIEFNKILLKK